MPAKISGTGSNIRKRRGDKMNCEDYQKLLSLNREANALLARRRNWRVISAAAGLCANENSKLKK